MQVLALHLLFHCHVLFFVHGESCHRFVTVFCRCFVEEKLGTKYVESRSLDFSVSYEESGRETAIFFILSPGVDPLKDVEKLGHKLGFSVEQENFHNISLGQGQEAVAETALDIAAKNGHWIVLQVRQ